MREFRLAIFVFVAIVAALLVYDAIRYEITRAQLRAAAEVTLATATGEARASRNATEVAEATRRAEAAERAWAVRRTATARSAGRTATARYIPPTPNANARRYFATATARAR